VGGVAIFWADAPRPYEVQLLFRGHRADEALATSGITHLVEHLGLVEELAPVVVDMGDDPPATLL
jgi:hypothetical protein